MEETNAFVAQRASVDSPLMEQDAATAETVRSQLNRERVVTIVLMVLCAAAVVPSLVHEGIVAGIFAAVVMFFMFGLLHWLARVAVFQPMRLVRFGTCVNTMTELAQRHLALVKYCSWKTPLPRFIAIEPGQRALFIEGPDTDYYALVVRPHQIVETKIEREQTVQTTTKHGSRWTYGFGSSGFGFISGARSKSMSKVIETAFLEISVVLNAATPPVRVVFPFGEQRRDAEDWVLAIRHMCEARS